MCIWLCVMIFGQSVEAFKHLRSVLAIDAAFLTGKFRGVLLTKIETLSNQP